MKLFLLRHGETEFNKLRIVQGSGVDAPLNETGQYQAQKFFEKYKNVPFEAVYCSSLQRTYQTIKNFEWLYPINKNSALNELSWGIIEGEEFKNEVSEIYWKINQVWQDGSLHEKIPNGDSPYEVWMRVNEFIDFIKKKHRSNVLICTHGRTLKIFLSLLLGYGLKYQDLFYHPNASLTVLKFIDNEHFIIEKLTDISHLNE